jgi:hypothetical protein
MATKLQIQAARENIKKAQTAAKEHRTLASPSEATRKELGPQGTRTRLRGSTAGRSLEDRNRQQLYALAREKGIEGRSAMGKHELIEAIRKLER